MRRSKRAAVRSVPTLPNKIMPSNKTLILVRHAHRDTDIPARDNGLSVKGREQVKKLTQFALRRLARKDFMHDEEDRPIALILTSPQKRCQETIAPLAKELGLKFSIDERVGEHQPMESNPAYLRRIKAFLDEWKKDGERLTIICSHGDWIPLAIQMLTGTQVEIRKSGWIEIKCRGDDCAITWMVQRHD